MRQIVTRGIVLSRTDYGEADRILTILTPDQGKISLLAKGVRRIKSKLAGGIELFSVSELTYIPGRNDLGTLISARMQQHFGDIVKNIEVTMLAYDLLKRLNRATEAAAGPEYFELLQRALQALNKGLTPKLTELWFDAQLLRLAGHQPNLYQDAAGQRLSGDQPYAFNFEQMVFQPSRQGAYWPSHIKFLRVVFGSATATTLQKVRGVDDVLEPCGQLVTLARQQYIS